MDEGVLEVFKGVIEAVEDVLEVEGVLEDNVDEETADVLDVVGVMR
jgi:hypothetical protein